MSPRKRNHYKNAGCMCTFSHKLAIWSFGRFPCIVDLPDDLFVQVYTGQWQKEHPLPDERFVDRMLKTSELRSNSEVAPQAPQ